MIQYDYLRLISPLLVQVELTEACNLKCKFCYNSQKPRYNRNVIQMLDLLAKQNVMQVTLTGGEPLMHPDFFDILQYATSHFPNVMILSNGTLMTDEIIEKISETGVMSVSISIHGDEETHEMLTCSCNSYRNSLHAIEKFLNIGKIPVASNFVLNACNIAVLEKTMETFHTMGLRFMTITRFVPVGIGRSAHSLEISREDMVKAMDFADRFMKNTSNPHIEFAEAIPYCAVPPHLKYLANTCSYGYDRFYVDIDGNLMVCGLSRILLGGNILETPIKEIKQHSSTFMDFITNEHVPTSCVSCETFDKCHGGCRAAAMHDGNWRQSYDSLCAKGK